MNIFKIKFFPLFLVFISLSCKSTLASNLLTNIDDYLNEEVPLDQAIAESNIIKPMDIHYHGDSTLNELFLFNAFMFGVKNSDHLDGNQHHVYFSPSKAVLQKWEDLNIGNACRYGILCKDFMKMKKDHTCLDESKKQREHYMLSAFHSTTANIVPLIWQNGYKSSSSGTMGSGVYVTVPVVEGRKGNLNNNKKALEKSHGYGSVIIINLVISRDGVFSLRKVNDRRNIPWIQGGADVKYLAQGKKYGQHASYADNAGENSVRNAEQVLPLGIIYKTTSGNPLNLAQ